MEGSGWNVLIVRRAFERIVAAHLTRQCIESYLPLAQSHSQLIGQTDSGGLTLFPGYVFCRCNGHDSVRAIPGVLSVVRASAKIQAVSDRQITDLRRILAAGLPFQKSPFTSHGQLVMIDDGPLNGVTGVLRQSANALFFVFSIELIRQSIALSVNANNLVVRPWSAPLRGLGHAAG
jgi:Transcription termination factor nusG